MFIYFKYTNNLLKKDSSVYINEITEQDAINIKKFIEDNRFGIINKSGIVKNGIDLSDREYFKTAVFGKSNLSEFLFNCVENQ